MPLRTVSLIVALALALASCGRTDVPHLQDRARAAWGEVVAQYARRAELVPTLVETTRSLAPGERELLTRVENARGRAASAAVTPETIADPESFNAYADAQAELSLALGRLLATLERYPELKADSRFATLLATLAGVEDRVVVAKRDYIDAVRAHNRELRATPDRWVTAFFHPGTRPLQAFETERLYHPSQGS